MQRTDLKTQLLSHWKIVICGIAFLSYVQTIAFPLVYDDKYLILENTYITSFRNLPRFFTMHLWDSFNAQFVNFYRPLLLTWSLLNHALFGFHPSGWHLTNILLHVTATYLVCVVTEKFIGDKGIAIIAGLFFAIHPVHLEVVAWASAASEMLLGIFILGSLLCFMRSNDEENRRRWLILAWLLYAGALFSKETAVMMPLMIFALVWLQRDLNESLSRKMAAASKAAAPFVVMVLGYCCIRWFIFGREHVESLYTTSIATMFRTIPLVIYRYLKLLILPFQLSPLYDVPDVESVTWITFVLPVALIAAIAGAIFLWWRRDRSKAIPFACLWGLWLVPALYLRAFSSDRKIGDRYVYIASVGFCILLATAIRRIRIPSRETFAGPVGQVAATLLAAVVLIYGTLSQQTYWSSDVLLFYRALEIAPNNDTAKENLAASLMTEEHYGQAIPLLLDVFQHKPQRRSILSYLGISYYHAGQYERAVDYLSRAIAIDASDARDYAYLGLAELKLGKPGLAADDFQNSLRIKPEQMECHFGLGLIFERRGEWQEAMREYDTALKMQPKNPALQRYVKAFQVRLSSPSGVKPSSEVDPEI